jgi:hypothetical protein
MSNDKDNVSFITPRDELLLTALIRGLKYLVSLLEKVKKGEKI